MKLISGLDVLEEDVGAGPAAVAGDAVTYKVRIILNRGDEVSAGSGDHVCVLGKRRVIAGIEKALTGMRAGGYRKVRVGPHLAYGESGVEGVIPANAVLEVSLWVGKITKPEKPSD